MNLNSQNAVKKICISLTTAAVLLMGNFAFADTPDSLKGATLVDAAKAKSLIDAGT